MIKEDLPTFERPIKAYSGCVPAGHFLTSVLLTTKTACFTSILRHLNGKGSASRAKYKINLFIFNSEAQIGDKKIAYYFLMLYLCASKKEDFMTSHEDILKNFSETFQNKGDKFHILEYRVPVEQQLEYFKYSFLMRKEDLKISENEYHTCQEKLENVNHPKEEKKAILTMLAATSDIRAYRLLERYTQHPDKELVNWASMALMECRIAIESELSGERQIYISTGLGGKDNKLRFYVLILSLKGASFADYQREVIEKEVGFYLLKSECEIERLTIKDNYVELVFLNPVTVDIRKILENIVLECNLYGNFLSSRIIITNVKEFSQKEVNQIIEKEKRGKKELMKKSR